MIAVCTKCGLTFEDENAFSIAGSTGNFSDNYISCLAPWCDGMAKFLDGTFHFDKDGVATLLDGPAFTIEVLKQFETLTKKALSKGYTPDEFKKEAEQINPALPAILTFLVSNRKEFFFLFLGALLSLITDIIKDKMIDKSPTVVNNYIINQNNYHINQSLSEDTTSHNPQISSQDDEKKTGVLSQKKAIRMSKAFKRKQDNKDNN